MAMAELKQINFTSFRDGGATIARTRTSVRSRRRRSTDDHVLRGAALSEEEIRTLNAASPGAEMSRPRAGARRVVVPFQVLPNLVAALQEQSAT